MFLYFVNINMLYITGRTKKELQSRNQLYQGYFGKHHFSTLSSNITHKLTRFSVTIVLFNSIKFLLITIKKTKYLLFVFARSRDLVVKAENS